METLIVVELNHFLLEQHKDLDWRTGIPRMWLQEEWREVLDTVQRYITCEGRYNKVYLYQMRFLCHIVGLKTMNLAYFLYKSLLKMSTRFQSKSNMPPHYVYHRGLIKILIQYHLSKKKITWDSFLVSEELDAISSQKKRGRPLKIVQKKGSKTDPKDKPPQFAASTQRITRIQFKKQLADTMGTPQKSPEIKVTYQRKKKQIIDSQTYTVEKLPEDPKQTSSDKVQVNVRVSPRLIEKYKEIHGSTTPDFQIPTPIIPLIDDKKRKRRLVFSETDTSDAEHTDTPEAEHTDTSDAEGFKTPEPKEMQSIKGKKVRKVKSFTDHFIQRPHTRPINKLRLKYKLLVNPKMKDLIINVDEEKSKKRKKVQAPKKTGLKSKG
jgi:hypothetical protein